MRLPLNLALFACWLALGCGGTGTIGGDARPSDAVTVSSGDSSPIDRWVAEAGLPDGGEADIGVAADTASPEPYRPTPATDIDAAIARNAPVISSWSRQLPHGVVDPMRVDASICHWVCHWAEHCGEIESFGGRQACPDRCRQMVAEGAAVNLACYAARCSARARCLPGQNLPVRPLCREICRYVRACPQYLLFNLPLDESTCETVCSGQAAAFPSFEEALPCFARNASSCDVDRMLQCLPNGELFCPALCEEVSGCTSYFPNREACYRTCDRYTPQQAWQARRCFDLYECRGDTSCLNAPIPQSCVSWGQLALRQCRDNAWPPSAQLLAVECALPLAVDGLEPVADPAACIQASAGAFACLGPGDPRPPTCVGQTPLACQRICEVQRRCPGMAIDGCEERCIQQFWRANRSRINEALQCFQDAACDPMIFRQCWSLQHTQPFCDRYCNLVDRCAPGTDFNACLMGCITGLSTGDLTRITTLACAADGTCDSYNRCRMATPPSIDPACRAACNTVRGNCHHVVVSLDTGEAACNTVCSERLRREVRAGDTAFAQCVVNDLDHECRPQNLTHCH